MIQNASRRIYFAGDSGYSNHFSDIKSKLGSPDIAFLGIGAYEPRWFMKPVHMNPIEDALALPNRTLNEGGLAAPKLEAEAGPPSSYFLLKNGPAFATLRIERSSPSPGARSCATFIWRAMLLIAVAAKYFTTPTPAWDLKMATSKAFSSTLITKMLKCSPCW